jgi:hypothetical protein
MARLNGRVNAQILFVVPEGLANGWEQGELWQQAQRIPGIQMAPDRDGKEAERFGSKTSGQVMLFAADGRSIFRGGITAGRGHVGANAGRSAIESIVLGAQQVVDSTMVFGCPLQNEGSDRGTSECKKP